jgi:hypothetical protein
VILVPLPARRVISTATARGIAGFAGGVVELECHDASPKIWLGVMGDVLVRDLPGTIDYAGNGARLLATFWG